MKYAPTLSDFHSGFFLVERAKEPYFLVTNEGELLRSNRVGERFIQRLMRTKPQVLEDLISSFNDLISGPKAAKVKATLTLKLGDSARRRLLRAVPVGLGAGYLVEIDRV
jgi:hypothetical protein